MDNQFKSAAEIAEEQRKKSEQEKRAKEAELQRIRKQAEAIACNYLRISGKWYKKCQNPDSEMVLEPVRASDILSDYGKKLGPAIISSAIKCINQVNIPEHIHYREIIRSASGDDYYNMYRPLRYTAAPGSFSHISTLIQHIFGDQYEMGMDYFQLLYTDPKRRLPILVLVSKENGTGKSTFCNFVKEIFGENAKAINRDSLESRFNSSWATKLVAYCEETLVDKLSLIDKIKNYATAENVPAERKGYDMTNEKVYIKLIMCSNDELHPTILDQYDTRHWVRKVPVIENNPGRDFLNQCKQEIPAFLHFLEERTLLTPGRDRLWFTPEEIRTDAWRRIVAGSKSESEKELIGLVEDLMDGVGLDEIEYSATELLYVVKYAPSLSDTEKRRYSKIKVRDVLRSWGLNASKENKRHDFYSMNYDGTVKLEGSRSSKVFRITKDLIMKLSCE